TRKGELPEHAGRRDSPERLALAHAQAAHTEIPHRRARVRGIRPSRVDLREIREQAHEPRIPTPDVRAETSKQLVVRQLLKLRARVRARLPLLPAPHLNHAPFYHADFRATGRPRLGANGLPITSRRLSGAIRPAARRCRAARGLPSGTRPIDASISGIDVQRNRQDRSTSFMFVRCEVLHRESAGSGVCASPLRTRAHARRHACVRRARRSFRGGDTLRLWRRRQSCAGRGGVEHTMPSQAPSSALQPLVPSEASRHEHHVAAKSAFTMGRRLRALRRHRWIAAPTAQRGRRSKTEATFDIATSKVWSSPARRRPRRPRRPYIAGREIAPHLVAEHADARDRARSSSERAPT
ncbi:MAG: hypothetical protein K0S65_5191, partial [Labilithrix sp.]|nr:hypothetical protein [Labilithrix sp.]